MLVLVPERGCCKGQILLVKYPQYPPGMHIAVVSAGSWSFGHPRTPHQLLFPFSPLDFS